MRSHITVRSLVVHHKDKRTMDQTTGIVYKIACTYCDKAYIGETSRMWSDQKRRTQRNI